MSVSYREKPFSIERNFAKGLAYTETFHLLTDETLKKSPMDNKPLKAFIIMEDPKELLLNE